MTDAATLTRIAEDEDEARAEEEFRKTHLGAADYADVARARITRDALIRAVLHLASIYADHPDYREEWKA